MSLQEVGEPRDSQEGGFWSCYPWSHRLRGVSQGERLGLGG